MGLFNRRSLIQVVGGFALVGAIAPGCTPSAGGGSGGDNPAVNDNRGGDSGDGDGLGNDNTGGDDGELGGLPAFPGAEGFGAFATGGRGGRVIYVTNLNAAGPGSVQAALDECGPRYVLFNVSGVIQGAVQLTRGDVTLAGQTSPGGIIVRGFHTTEEPYCDQSCAPPEQFAENWIMRHVRSRPGTNPPLEDGLRLRNTRNAIVDHCSMANAADEAVEITFSNRITVQHCILAETVGDHADRGGMLLNYSNPRFGFELDRISIHHNCWNRIGGRFPEVSRESPDAARTVMDLEISNNLLRDQGYFVELKNETFPDSAGSEPVYYRLNWVGNVGYARAGFLYGMIWLPDPIGPGTSAAFFIDNHLNLYPEFSDWQLRYCRNDFATFTPDPAPPAWAGSARLDHPAINYLPSADLRAHVLSSAGALPRDPMDRRLMQPVADETLDSAPVDTNPCGDAFELDFSADDPPPPPEP